MQKTFFVMVVSVVCDTQVRAFIRGVKSHRANHGCDKCHQPNVHKSNQITFPEVSAMHGNDDSFRQTTDEEHQCITHHLQILALTWLLASHMILCTWFVWM